MNTAIRRSVRICFIVSSPLLLLLVMLFVFARTGAAGTLPNGVAAGDTTQTSAVLWVRGTTTGDVLFKCSTDPSFSTDVLSRTATITETLVPVTVEITKLTPATTYFYQVADAANMSTDGQFRTAAVTGTHTGLRFGVSGDWEAGLAPYVSISNAADRNLDVFVEHGDTIGAGTAATPDEFRLKYSEVYSTHLGLNTWADLRSSTSILATIDDNNVRDNFAGGAPPSKNPDFSSYSGTYINETQLYSNALQAFQEYNPLRNEFYGTTGDDRTANKRKLYRSNTYGSDAAVFLLDTRSFRDRQLDVPTNALEALQFLNDSFNLSNRTMIGAQQLTDLKADLLQAQADGVTWKFILATSPIQNLGLIKAEDRFEGYAAERSNLLKFIKDSGIENVVFIAGSLHGTIVNNLKYQESYLGVQTPTGAFEVIVGPVAIGPPFGPLGPATIPVAASTNPPVVTPEELDYYNDINRTREEKDQFVEEVLNRIISPPYSLVSYDPIGLEGSGIDATLLQGRYVAAHTYGWTEFEIDQGTQVLTVTIDYYTAAELETNPTDIINRTPAIVSQFVVTPTGNYVSNPPDPATRLAYLPAEFKD
jgi:alkaline phosphatase D